MFCNILGLYRYIYKVDLEFFAGTRKWREKPFRAQKKFPKKSPESFFLKSGKVCQFSTIFFARREKLALLSSKIIRTDFSNLETFCRIS
jgi:hypothetical protein